MDKTLDQARLKTIIHYDPETGSFKWRVKKYRVNPDQVAGYLGKYGYWIIKIDQRKYPAHRLAWLYVTGKWPTDLIDHINMVRDDNRISNLREATHKQNHENNMKPMRGIRWEADRERWLVRIKHNGYTKNLGRFVDLDDAINVRREAERRLFTHSPACELQSSYPDPCVQPDGTL